MISQTKTGAVVESMLDKRRFPVFASEKISTLEEISIFTTGEDMPLKDVFKAIHDKKDEGENESKMDNQQLRAFINDVIPDIDNERVYASDMKKIVSWYKILKTHDMLDFTDDEAKEEEGDKEDSAGEKNDVKNKPEETKNEKED